MTKHEKTSTRSERDNPLSNVQPGDIVTAHYRTGAEWYPQQPWMDPGIKTGIYLHDADHARDRGYVAWDFHETFLERKSALIPLHDTRRGEAIV